MAVEYLYNKWGAIFVKGFFNLFQASGAFATNALCFLKAKNKDIVNMNVSCVFRFALLQKQTRLVAINLLLLFANRVRYHDVVLINGVSIGVEYLSLCQHLRYLQAFLTMSSQLLNSRFVHQSFFAYLYNNF